MQWDGPIDRIEIVDINPEEDDDPTPFEAATDCTAAREMSYEQLLRSLKHALARHDNMKIRELQQSPYYDDAIAEIRDCMRISAAAAVQASSGSQIDFYNWYDLLDAGEQADVDDLADNMGLPLYDDCSDMELSQLHDVYYGR